MRKTIARNMPHCFFVMFVYFLLTPFLSVGQWDSDTQVLNKFNSYRSKTLQEKMYVHTDRSFYLTGETVWFSIYTLNTSDHKPIDISKVAYIEILDKNNSAVAQAKIELNNGRGNGAILLSPVISSGPYLIRAYSHWMKNFSPDFYFQKAITIVNTFKTKGEDVSIVQPQLPPDVQFFSEGGNCLEGIESKIAFKAVDAEGNSLDFKGAIINQSNDTVAHFHPFKFGIGSFQFTPKSDEAYKAVIRSTSGKISIHNFVRIEDQGLALTLKNSNESLKLTVQEKSGDNSFVFLLAHTRNEIVFSGRQKISKGKAEFTIDKAKLGEGITSFTIFDDTGRPACERLFFKRVDKRIHIDAKTNQENSPSKNKATLSISTQLADEVFVPASISVSIYRADSLEVPIPNDILNYLYLNSELKGNIESPDYYLQPTVDSNKEEVDEAIDNLMLTQGWRRFAWRDILTKKDSTIKYLPELRGPLVSAQVVERSTGKGVRGLSLLLSFPGLATRFYGGISRKNGELFLETNFLYGPHTIIAQVQPPSDSLYSVEIMDSYSTMFSTFKPPSFKLDKGWKAQLTQRSIHMQLLNAYQYDIQPKLPMTQVLRDTSIFYGKPDERYVLDDYTRFTTMEDVMREYVKGVWVRKKDYKFKFLLPHAYRDDILKDPLITLDGLPIFEVDNVMNVDPLKIKQIDVMKRRVYHGRNSFNGLVGFTSYKGNLAELNVDSKAQKKLYEGLQLHKEFYVPKYDAESKESRIPDFRELLYWNPAIETDKNGKATTEFYTSEQRGTYFIVLQGITNEGVAGCTIKTLKVTGTQ
jgi:hypothetical protein